MKLEFKVFKLKEESQSLKYIKNRIERLKKDGKLKYNLKNEFIIVGEENEYYKVQQLHENGLTLVDGLDIEELSLRLLKKELEWDGVTFTILDIPKKYLNIDIVDNIKIINS